MATAPRRHQPRGGGLYLAVTLAALLVTLYLVSLMIGFLFKLIFLVGAVLIARAAWRAWKAEP